MSVTDPGDPFVRGSIRFEARQALLEALETLVDEVKQDDGETRVRDLPAWDDVLRAHKKWALYGRDGE
jgi:hypothetical protein